MLFALPQDCTISLTLISDAVYTVVHDNHVYVLLKANRVCKLTLEPVPQILQLLLTEKRYETSAVLLTKYHSQLLAMPNVLLTYGITSCMFDELLGGRAFNVDDTALLMSLKRRLNDTETLFSDKDGKIRDDTTYDVSGDSALVQRVHASMTLECGDCADPVKRRSKDEDRASEQSRGSLDARLAASATAAKLTLNKAHVTLAGFKDKLLQSVTPAKDGRNSSGEHHVDLTSERHDYDVELESERYETLVDVPQLQVFDAKISQNLETTADDVRETNGFDRGDLKTVMGTADNISLAADNNNHAADKHAVNTRHTAGKTRHTADNTSHSADNTSHAADDTGHSADNTSHAANNTSHSAGKTRHAADNTSHAADNTSHAADDTSHAADNASDSSNDSLSVERQKVRQSKAKVIWFDGEPSEDQKKRKCYMYHLLPHAMGERERGGVIFLFIYCLVDEFICFGDIAHHWPVCASVG